MEELVEKLRKYLEEMKPWEKKPLVEVGRVIVELVKLPERRTKRGVEKEKLAIHLRLKDSFRGVFIEDYDELDDILRALEAENVRQVARALSRIKVKEVIEYEI